MRQRRLLRFHGLKRPRVRQTWNKYNLFNLWRLRTPLLQNKTFFQQKWIAKSMTRGYHGEHIKEYQWERMFSRRLLSAVNMDPAYMAQHDGSEQASGRGSGRKGARGAEGEKTPRNRGNLDGPTPYMQMIFAPMERRLDVAIFRALFASSARQARQFVLHGAVTVNGKKMTYPGYLLNPGDMFQVNIERVMAATGRPKMPSKNQKALPPSESTEAAEGEEGEAAEGEATEAAEGAAEPVDADAAKEQHMATLKDLKARANKVMSIKNVHLRAKQKQSLRKFLQEVKTTMDRTRKSSDPSKAEMDDVERELTALLSDLSMTPAQLRAEAKQAYIERNKKQDRQLAAASDPNADASTTAQTLRAGAAAASLGLLTDAQRGTLKWMMQREAENPHDASKPYATPWKPREWMSPFAFIPRYLEVNQRICAAVYLRHPVARPGKSEVPSPFSPTLSQLAFNWYLRRG